jgi:hypothetical protein
MTVVVNIKNETCDVYIGRPSIFGNPFSVEQHGRERCILMYKSWFWARVQRDKNFEMKVRMLEGRTLGCYCAPKPCHGDVIVAYLEYRRSIGI